MIDLDNLPEPGPIPPARRSADRQLLLEFVSSHRRHRRPAMAGAFVAGGALLATGTAYAVDALSPQPATVHDIAYCYPSASLDGPRSGVAVATVPGQPPADVASNAIRLCEGVWRLGGVQKFGPPDADGYVTMPTPDPNVTVPHMVACVLPSGEAAVFPGDAGTCGSLDLPPLEQQQ
jgi:hypothetical protein